ncbi:PTS phosphocarrier protein NPr [Moellerella wisconsensis]|uniref:Phosphocarrier protein NPr n=2 Tax=Moellerella wisconsensis TaxID=158849 RepID=A0A0N1KIQ9_9GAMM|nr:PTS phosphocarrier protein NPr [Moellerella wisconsensis]KLN97761.1 phosphohistidinoprotein-hexose phosphotransferase [Moellerella wisconsensis]KPD04486.1 nitrogen regulation-associated phosphocarrier protein [Moellerella wisconsensis ATCC 35017]UNH24578.1 PTS phosphocarrier protein NPr [Moellerella wisconsensis]UNH27683.1 PTS phosphocarrier protein NPr [Moellerella wisconsensis]UNH31180.1 PTS phosphocarrier protein NPr [Moellerella wisconsensis]
MTVHASITLKNRLGMHARPAMMLYELVQKYQSKVILRNNNHIEAEADSVIAMLMLDSEQGSKIDIEVTGPDEKLALSAIVALFDCGFDED